MQTKKPSNLVFESSLQSYFFKELAEINKNSNPHLPQETIFYSSQVMEQFEISEKYFEKTESGFREKILGIKLLEVANLSPSQAIRCLKDVGDTALFLCGFFSESLNRKLIDKRYYHDIGKMAYERLDPLVPNVLEKNSFYRLLSNNFTALVMLISLVSKKANLSNDFNTYIIKEPDEKVN